MQSFPYAFKYVSRFAFGLWIVSIPLAGYGEAVTSSEVADVAQLVRALKAKSWTARRDAAETLAKLGPAAQSAVPALAKVLRDRQWLVRAAAAKALGQLGPVAKEAAPALRKALRDDKPMVREAAAQALGRMGPAAAGGVPALRRALRDENAEVRKAAIEALALIGPAAKDALPDLIKVVRKGRDSDVRLAATETLSRLVDEESLDVLPRLLEILADIVNDEQNWRSKQMWMAMLKNPRTSAAERLVILDSLKDTLKHDKFRIGGEARLAQAGGDICRAIGRIGVAAVPELIDTLGHNGVYTRTAAAKALGCMGSKARDAIPVLIRALRKDNSSLVRAQAVKSLAFGARNKEALPVLLDALSDSDEGVRWEAAFSLSSIGSISTGKQQASLIVSHIARLQRSRERSDRVAAAITLGHLARYAPHAVSLLISALGDRDPGVRYEAAVSLGDAGPDAKAAVPALIEGLQDKDPQVRVQVARALERIGADAGRAIPALQRAMKDRDPNVSMAAQRALKKIKAANATAIELTDANTSIDLVLLPESEARWFKVSTDKPFMLAISFGPLPPDVSAPNLIAAVYDQERKKIKENRGWPKNFPDLATGTHFFKVFYKGSRGRNQTIRVTLRLISS